MDAVRIQDVTKTFGKVTAVDSLSLKVPEGAIYGLIGPNGSGKTTTMRMVMNIFYPDKGRIWVFDREVSGSVFDNVGYLPEERGLYKKMKVRELLQFYGRLKSGRQVNTEVDDWLERLDLTDWADKKVETLSKGMSQKVQFIATIVSHPEVAIMDEPFAGLDPVNTDVLREALLELRSQGMTVVLSTHDMALAESMCDRICMIFKGRKVLDGTLSSIQERYGQDTIRLRTTDGLNDFNDIIGVDGVRNFGRIQELRMAEGGDPQEILTEIMARTRIESFEIVSPSLHDIFVRIVGAGGKEAMNE
ncbi:MAG TPA: ATP-binding cassette domain-containing protein [bacterium]|nr:ATP-binding cassette domain-containing protein [bacterium]